jgi:hypothetical protein
MFHWRAESHCGSRKNISGVVGPKGHPTAGTNAVTLWEQFPFLPHAFFVVAHVEKQPVFPVWLFV